MTPYEIYENIIDAYKNGEKEKVSYYAELWMSEGLDNPFPSGIGARDLYYNASLNYSRYRKGVISSRRSRVLVGEYIWELASLNISNPYVKKEQQKQKKTKKVLEEQTIVLGVVPEENIEHVEEQAIEPAVEIEPVKEPLEKSEPETISVPQVSKEPEDEKKGFFSKRKKRQ